MGFLGTFLGLLVPILQFAILGRVIASWVDPQGSNQISRMLHDLTEPILAPIRALLPSTGMLDLSPIIAFMLLYFISSILVAV